MTVIAIMIDGGSVIVTVLHIVCIAMVTVIITMVAGVDFSGVGVMQQMVFRSRWSTRIQTHIYLIQTLAAVTTIATTITIIGAASKGGNSVRK